MDIAKLVLAYIKTLVWPALVLTLGFEFRRELRALMARVRHAELPGGIALDFPQEIAEAKKLSATVEARPPRVPTGVERSPSIPLTEANARMIKLGLRPSPSGLDMEYYRALASQDPNLALAGLGIEIDVLARNLAKHYNISGGNKEGGVRLVRKLYDGGAISNEQMRLGIKVLQLCNAAVHGNQVSLGEAESVIDIASVLAQHFLAWLSWGFEDGWRPPEGRDAPATG